METISENVCEMPRVQDEQQQPENGCRVGALICCFNVFFSFLLLLRPTKVVSTVTSNQEGCRFDSGPGGLSVWRLYVLPASVWVLSGFGCV